MTTNITIPTITLKAGTTIFQLRKSWENTGSFFWLFSRDHSKYSGNEIRVFKTIHDLELLCFTNENLEQKKYTFLRQILDVMFLNNDCDISPLLRQVVATLTAFLILLSLLFDAKY